MGHILVRRGIPSPDIHRHPFAYCWAGAGPRKLIKVASEVASLEAAAPNLLGSAVRIGYRLGTPIAHCARSDLNTEQRTKLRKRVVEAPIPCLK